MAASCPSPRPPGAGEPTSRASVGVVVGQASPPHHDAITTRQQRHDGLRPDRSKRPARQTRAWRLETGGPCGTAGARRRSGRGRRDDQRGDHVLRQVGCAEGEVVVSGIAGALAAQLAREPVPLAVFTAHVPGARWYRCVSAWRSARCAARAGRRSGPQGILGRTRKFAPRPTIDRPPALRELLTVRASSAR